MPLRFDTEHSTQFIHKWLVKIPLKYQYAKHSSFFH